MIRFGEMTHWLSTIPNRKQLERLSIKELILVANHKKIKGKSLKTVLIDYIMNFKEIG